MKVRYIFLLLILMTNFCTKREKSDIVAKWKQISITIADFERSYFLFWQSTHFPDSPELRKNHARQLIEQEIIGKSEKLDQHPLLQKRLKRDSERFARRRYLERILKDTLRTPSDAEVEKALERKTTRLYVRQLYAESEADIRRLAAIVNAEQSIEPTVGDSLFRTRGQVLGWLGWGDTDLPVEEVLYTMKTGEISRPIQSLMGWHIFRLDSVEQTLTFAQQSDGEISDMRTRLFERQFDMAVAHHLRELLWSKPLAVNVKIMKRMWEALQPNLPTHAREWATMPADRLTEIRDPDLAGEIVATVDDEPFTVGEFFDAIPDLPREHLRPNLKKALEIAIRDRILTRQALAQGMDEDPVVQEKTHRTKTTCIYTATIAAAAESVQLDPHAYFLKNRDRYQTTVSSEVHEILVSDRDTAIALAKRIHGGEDFAPLARRYSLRPSARTNGGYLGFLSADEGPIGQKAAQLREGAIFAPIRTDDGFSVIVIGQHRYAYPEFGDIENRATQDARRDYLEQVHQSLLPPDYRPEDIHFDETLLKEALSQKRKTIF